MSIAAQKWAWDQKIDNHAAKLLLITLADQADGDGAVRYGETSPKFFAHKCSFSVRTFWRCIKILMRAHHVRGQGKEKAKAKGGRGVRTTFWLCMDPSSMDNLAQFSDEKLCQIVQENEKNCAKSAKENTTVGTVSASVHYTRNQSTKESTSARARARAPSAHASARKEVAAKEVAATPAPKELVYFNTRFWRNLEDLERLPEWRRKFPISMAKATRMANSPAGKERDAAGNLTGRNGWYFPPALVAEARSQAARATGPPDDDDFAADTSDDTSADTEPGNGHNASDNTRRQLARRLRGFAGSLDGGASDRAGGSQSADGASRGRLAS
jgi:hypothetical protein